MAENLTQEYTTLQKLVPELRLAVQKHLVPLTGPLLAKELITDVQDIELRNEHKNEVSRAADLISIVLNKVKLDPRYFKVFIDILKNNGVPDIDNLITQTETEPQVKPKSKRLSIALENDEIQNGPSTSTMIRTSTVTVTPTNPMQPTLELECNCPFCISVLIDKYSSTVAINFPMLNLGVRRNEDDNFQLKRETRSIMMQFHRIESGLYDTVKLIPVGDLKFHLKAIKASQCEESIFSNYDEDKLQEARDARSVFYIACKFWSFLDYDLLEHLIDILGSDDDKKRMVAYRQNFAQYATRRIKECPSIEPNTDGKWKKVCIKLDSKLESTTINDLREFRSKVGKILDIPVLAIHFCCVQKGCIEVTWQIPSFINKIIFPLLPEKEKMLEQLGVIQLSCLDYVYTAPKMNPQVTLYDSNHENKSNSTDRKDSIENTETSMAITFDHMESSRFTNDAWKILLEHFQQGIHPKDQKDWDEFIKAGNKIRILVTGATGVGKSTLLNGLIGKKIIKPGDKIDDNVTTQVTEYNFQENGVEIVIFVSSGLYDGLDPEKEVKYIKDMFKKINAHDGIDLILFCKQMDTLTTSANAKVEQNVIQRLTDCLGKLKDNHGKRNFIGKDIWHRSLFVLTFANEYETNLFVLGDKGQSIDKPFKKKINECKDFYKQALNACGIYVPVTDRICVAGHEDPRLCITEHWLSDFWATAFELLQSHSENGALALLRLNQHRIVESATFKVQNPEEQPIVLTNRVKTAFGYSLAGVGAAGTASAVTGAAIGATIGALTIGTISFGPAAGAGLVIGGAIGAAVGTAIGGGILRAWQRHKAKKEEAQREAESQL